MSKEGQEAKRGPRRVVSPEGKGQRATRGWVVAQDFSIKGGYGFGAGNPKERQKCERTLDPKSRSIYRLKKGGSW